MTDSTYQYYTHALFEVADKPYKDRIATIKAFKRTYKAERKADREYSNRVK